MWFDWCHTYVFNESLGTLQEYEAQLYADSKAKTRVDRYAILC